MRKTELKRRLQRFRRAVDGAVPTKIVNLLEGSLIKASLVTEIFDKAVKANLRRAVVRLRADLTALTDQLKNLP